MARNEPQVNLRIPEQLKSALEAASARNNRSLTAEIVARLEQSFQAELTLETLAIALDERDARLKRWIGECLNGGRPSTDPMLGVNIRETPRDLTPAAQQDKKRVKR